MRKSVLPLLTVAALALAGCNAPNSSSTDNAASAASSGGAGTAKVVNEVNGTISLRAGSAAPSPTATLVLNLANVSASAAGSPPLASKTSPAGTFPQPFSLTFNPAEVAPDGLYVVQAILTDGDRHYSMPMQATVLGKGSKNTGISIQLVAEQTPSEKLLAEFTAEQKLLGGMKISHGTKLEKDVSRGWQVFRQGDELKFIREEVDYGAKGYSSTDYAYKDGKAWAIVQQTKPSRDGKATSIDRAGWSDDGSLVLKQHQVGDDVQALSADDAAKLKKQAKDILDLATKGKGK